jgi:hypothetical protein
MQDYCFFETNQAGELPIILIRRRPRLGKQHPRKGLQHKATVTKIKKTSANNTTHHMSKKTTQPLQQRQVPNEEARISPPGDPKRHDLLNS